MLCSIKRLSVSGGFRFPGHIFFLMNLFNKQQMSYEPRRKNLASQTIIFPVTNVVMTDEWRTVWIKG